MTSPAPTKPCSREDRVFGLIPGSPPRNSVKRFGPVSSSRTISVAQVPSIQDEHYPPRPGHHGDRIPRATSADEAAFLALGSGAAAWLIEAAPDPRLDEQRIGMQRSVLAARLTTAGRALMDEMARRR